MVFIARSFTVDGPSMLPTLHSGERLLVDKLTYRFASPTGRDHRLSLSGGSEPSLHQAGDRRSRRSRRDPRGRGLVNGVALEETYISSPTSAALPRASCPKITTLSWGTTATTRRQPQSPGGLRAAEADHRAGRLVRYWPVTRAGLLAEPSVAQAAKDRSVPRKRLIPREL